MSSVSNGFSSGASSASALIYGLSGLKLSQDERLFFQEANPLGFILFKRNCDTPDQILALTQELKALVGRNCPILIDQEGGRVQRLAPPHWRSYPNLRDFGERAEEDLDSALEALRFNSLQMIEDLKNVGVNVNCTPVLDLIIDGAHDIVGDRSFGSDTDIVARLGLSVCRHYLANAVTPIIKHIPGHGRALADSHLELPVVDTDKETLRKSDFVPFASLACSDVGAHVWAMSAHVIYAAYDAELPATISPEVIETVIRGEIGFDGVLLSDDLDMKALAPFGDVADRALKSLDAGCDIALHCSGEMADMQKIAEKAPKLSEKAQKRLQRADSFQRVAA